MFPQVETSPPSHSPDIFQRLREMFPEIDEEIITNASVNCKDLNAATEMVLQQGEFRIIFLIFWDNKFEMSES